MLETKFCPNCHCPYDASLPECPVCKRSAAAAAKKARQEDLNDALHGEKREALHQILHSKLRTGQDEDQDATVIADPAPEAEAPDQGDGAVPAAAEQVTDNQALLDEMLPGDPEESAPPEAQEAPEGDPVPPAVSPDHLPRKGGKSPVGKVVLAVLIVALVGLLCFGGYALLSSSDGGTGTAGSSGAASSEPGDSQEGSASETQGEDAQADDKQEDESQTEDGGETADPAASSAEDGSAGEDSDGDGSVDGGDGETGTDQTGDGAADSETTPDASAEGGAETETPDADEDGETAGDSGAEAESGNTDSNTSEENSDTDSLSSDNIQPETADTGVDAGDIDQAAA
ncbi:MAG: hypothetical protein LUF28_03075 [Clostridiales bacterium]|nr:hypothetical protein [Clostridiales bacterium]